MERLITLGVYIFFQLFQPSLYQAEVSYLILRLELYYQTHNLHTPLLFSMVQQKINDGLSAEVNCKWLIIFIGMLSNHLQRLRRVSQKKLAI